MIALIFIMLLLFQSSQSRAAVAFSSLRKWPTSLVVGRFAPITSTCTSCQEENAAARTTTTAATSFIMSRRRRGTTTARTRIRTSSSSMVTLPPREFSLFSFSNSRFFASSTRTTLAFAAAGAPGAPAEKNNKGRRRGKKNGNKVIPSSFSSTKHHHHHPHPLPERVRQVLCCDVVARILSLPEFSMSQKSDNDNTTTSNDDDDDDDDEVVIVLVVGVSGGCDSMGLLQALMQIAEPRSTIVNDDIVAEWRIPCKNNNNNNNMSNNNNNVKSISYEIHVVHFDHEQRGDESTADKALVENVANELQLQFHCYSWSQDHNHDNGATTTLFSQETARKWRQARMEQLLTRLLLVGSNMESSSSSSSSSRRRRCRHGVVLTAHHRDDSNESLLLKILRGAHISNLQGMEQTVMRQVVLEEYDNDDEKEPSFYYYLQSRPLLSVSKQDIQDYLTSNNWTWREDSSNHDPNSKYLRNRVRNQLVPLLSDMVGGSDVLHQRLDNLNRQSHEIQNHLVKEAQKALLVDHHRHTTNNDSGSFNNDYFLLPSKSTSLDLVHKQALHMWVCDTTTTCSCRRRQSFNNKNTNAIHQHAQRKQHHQHQFTFEQLDRVCKQIENFPTNRQWRLNIGGGWDVMRQGDVLSLIETDIVPIQQQTETNNDDTTRTTRIVEWSLVPDNECMTVTTNTDTAAFDDTSSSSSLYISVPKTILFSEQPVFYFSTINGLEKAPFTPSWRKGHDPIRLKEFLRGQKVPLHLRRHSRVIYFKPKHSSTSGTTSADFDDSDNDKTIVAVWVPTKEKWITNDLFACSNDLDDSDSFAKILLNVANF